MVQLIGFLLSILLAAIGGTPGHASGPNGISGGGPVGSPGGGPPQGHVIVQDPSPQPLPAANPNP